MSKTIELLIKAKDEASKVVKSFSGAVEELADESKNASKAVSEISSSLDDNKSSLKLINDFESLRQKLTSIKQANTEYTNSLSKQKSQVDSASSSYNKLTKELLEAKKRLDELNSATPKDKVKIVDQRATIREITESRKKSLAVLKQEERELKKIKSTFEQHSKQQKIYQSSINKVSKSLKENGIKTNDLDRKKKQLLSTIKRLTSENLKYNSAVKSSNDSTRQSLSIIARARAEVATLTLSYVGLHASVQSAKDAFVAYNEVDASRSKLTAAFDGDKELAKEELEFVRELSDELGLNFRAMMNDYASFFTSAKISGEDTEKIRAIFENIAKGISVNKLTADQSKGILLSLTQMMSKQVVMAEELQNQFAERMPGAVDIFARSIGKTSKELRKMMELGQVSSDMVLGFSIEIANQFSSGLDVSTNSLLANFNRLDNVMTELKVLFVSFSSDELTSSIDRMAKSLGDGGATNAVELLSLAISKLINLFSFFIENIDEVIKAVKVLIGLKLASIILGWAQSFRKANGAAVGFLATITALKKRVLPLIAIFSGLSYAFENLKALTAGLTYYFEKLRVLISGVFDMAGKFAKLKLSPKEFIKSVKEIGKSLDELEEKTIDGLIKGGQESQVVPNKYEQSEESKKRQDAAKKESELRKKEFEDKVKLDNLERERSELLKKFNSEIQIYEKDKAKTIEQQTALINKRYDSEIEALRKVGLIKEAERLNEVRLFKIKELNQQNDSKYRKESVDGQKELIKANKEAYKSFEELLSIKEKLLNNINETSKLNKESLVNNANLAESQIEKALSDLDFNNSYIDKLKQSGGFEDFQQALEIEKINEVLSQEIDFLTQKAINAWRAVGGVEAEDAINRLSRARVLSSELEKSIVNTDEVVNDLSGGLAKTAVSLASGFGGAISGANSLADAFNNAANTFSEFAQGFLSQIAEMIAKALILESIKGFAGEDSFLSNALSVNHNGTSAIGNMFRTGSISRGDEYLSILQRGERVLSRDEVQNFGSTKIDIIDQRSSDAPPIETQRDNSGQFERIKLIIKDTVKSDFDSGVMDSTMSQFGAVRTGVRR